MHFCESCNSREVSLHVIRADLEYWVCRFCGHCLKKHKADAIVDFQAAQDTYFGEGSILLQSAPSVVDREILATRIAVAERYLGGDDTVLEVGPGAGFFAEWLAVTAHQVILVEHSKALADLLRAKLGVQVESYEFENCTISEGTARAFCSFHVIEHVANPLRHLKRGLDLVEPGGYGFVATPNAGSWQQRAFRRLSPNFDEAHLRVFSKKSFCALCVEAGWQIIYVSTPEYASGWMRVITKAIRKLRGEEETLTAGKYSIALSGRFESVYRIAAALTRPIRYMQGKLHGGNEIFVVLRKPAANFQEQAIAKAKCV